MGEHHLWFDKSNGAEAIGVFGAGKRPGDTADVGAALCSFSRGELIFGDDIEIPNLPPGLRTRNISLITAGLSVDRLITQFEIITSMDSAGSGMSSI